MIISHKYEGKNKEELIKNCFTDLNETEENIYYYFTEIEGSLFKGKKIILNAITKSEIIEGIKEFFMNFSTLMNVKLNVEIKIKENTINIILISDNNNIIIGKEGKTLNALQLILRQKFLNLNNYDLKIILDVNNYKEKKLKHLEYETKKICEEVLKTKIEVRLDPMNSFERRLVHSIVSKYENLSSSSVGEAPNRYTIIKYKD